MELKNIWKSKNVLLLNYQTMFHEDVAGNHQDENIIIHPPQEIQIQYFKIMYKWNQIHVIFNCVHTMLAVFQTFQYTK